MTINNLYDASYFEMIDARLAAGASLDEALDDVPVAGTIEIVEPDECPSCGGPVLTTAFHGCCSQECYWEETEDKNPVDFE
jgi:hypothetical protein